MNHEFDPKDPIQVALQPAPMDREPREDLVRKLRVMGQHMPARSSWWRKSGLPLALAGTTALVVGAVLMLPAKASAKSFDLIVAAAQRVNAYQFSIVSNENAKQENFTIAGADGHVYMRADGNVVMEIATDTLSFYDPQEKKILRMKFGGMVDPAMIADEVRSGISEGMKDMNLQKMLDEYRHKYGTRNLLVSPVTREDGQDVYHVRMSSDDQPERVEMTVDAKTDLPDTILVESREGSTWKTAVHIEMRFGNRVDPSLLRSSFPVGVKVEELDLGNVVGDAMKSLGDQMKGLGDEIKKGMPKKDVPK